jgi:hypothetical protein
MNSDFIRPGDKLDSGIFAAGCGSRPRLTGVSWQDAAMKQKQVSTTKPQRKLNRLNELNWEEGEVRRMLRIMWK